MPEQRHIQSVRAHCAATMVKSKRPVQDDDQPKAAKRIRRDAVATSTADVNESNESISTTPGCTGGTTGAAAFLLAPDPMALAADIAAAAAAAAAAAVDDEEGIPRRAVTDTSAIIKVAEQQPQAHLRNPTTMNVDGTGDPSHKEQNSSAKDGTVYENSATMGYYGASASRGGGTGGKGGGDPWPMQQQLSSIAEKVKEEDHHHHATKEEQLPPQPAAISISTLVTEGLWDEDARVVEKALTQVADKSFGNEHARAARISISLTGGLLAIVKALQRFAHDAMIQATGCRALQNLALDPNNKTAIVNAGGIPMIVQAMKAFPWHEGIQMCGCGTFQNLLWSWGNNNKNDNTNNNTNHNNKRKRIYDAGGIPVIIQAMNQHPDATDLIDYACGAIYLLTIDDNETTTTATSTGEQEQQQQQQNRQVQEALLKHQALTALAQAIDNHWEDGGILEKGRNSIARLLWPPTMMR